MPRTKARKSRDKKVRDTTGAGTTWVGTVSVADPFTESTWQEVGPIETKEDIERKIAHEAEEKAAREAEESAGKELLDVYNKARDAYYLKKKFEDNPYPVRSRLGLAWMFGFELSQCRDYLRSVNQDRQIDVTWYKQEVERMESELNRSRAYKVNVVMKVPKTAFAQAK